LYWRGGANLMQVIDRKSGEYCYTPSDLPSAKRL
jgi:hypothetical protein